MQNNIRVVLFDLGNVLIDFDHTIAAKRISKFCNKSVEEVFRLFFSSDITWLFEKGDISSEDFFKKVKILLGAQMSYEQFTPIWNEIFSLSEENLKVLDLVKGLRPRYKTAMLSNVNILHWEYLKKNFSVFDNFDFLFASCELHAIKPEADIYKKVLEKLDMSAENIFYTDDREELITGAATLGIRGVVFKGAGQLKDSLLESGVIID